MVQKKRFTLSITTEVHLNILSRLHQIFSRHRILYLDFQSRQIIAEAQFVFSITVHETDEKVAQLYRQIVRQVDVLSITIFEEVDNNLRAIDFSIGGRYAQRKTDFISGKKAEVDQQF